MNKLREIIRKVIKEESSIQKYVNYYKKNSTRVGNSAKTPIEYWVDDEGENLTLKDIKAVMKAMKWLPDSIDRGISYAKSRGVK